MELYNSDMNAFYIPLTCAGRLYGVRFIEREKALNVTAYSHAAISDADFRTVCDELDFRFTLSMPYAEFYDQHRNDKLLRNVMKRNKGKHIATNYSLYHHLLVAILLQNTTIERTITMCGNLLKQYGHPIEFDDVSLIALWEPDEMTATEEEIRGFKVGYRARSIRRLTDYFLQQSSSLASLKGLSTEQLETELSDIPGVGAQTLSYLMSSHFHRADYLRHVPTWERRILGRFLLNRDDVPEAELIAWFKQRYGRWCAYALSLILEEIFFQHKEKPFEWLNSWMKKARA